MINETLGFDAGDELIRQIARLLEPSRLPPGTLGGRIAGDVFVIVSPSTQVQEAVRAARLCKRLSPRSAAIYSREKLHPHSAVASRRSPPRRASPRR